MAVLNSNREVCTMPILNREDAADVEEQISQVFAVDQSRRSDELRKLFVEKLDFEPVSGFISLTKATTRVDLPERAERLATMSGVTAVYVPLDTPETDRVRKAEAAAAAKLVSDELAGEILLVMTNSSASQVHFIYPTFEGARPSLRRLIIERDLPRRTAVQQVSNIYWNWNDTKDIRGAIEKVYDVEKVTADFFREYKRIFDDVMEGIQGFGTGEEDLEAKKLLVQTLFNRLMFVYFMSRKGWLNFNGDQDYLNALWRDYRLVATPQSNFYRDRLELLFFSGLDTANNINIIGINQGGYLKTIIGDVPFINGGLFDNRAGNNHRVIVVPDESVQIIFRELFDPFNFTVMESTPLDVEVAVDPEMLGKVFEELVTGRHQTGSYYTPRPVVSFMCRESLKGYLETKNTGASREAIEAFIGDDHVTSGLGIAAAPRIAEALNEIKVVDPGCGSGAYLLGMMQELVELKTALYSDQLSHESKDLYELKLQIIEDSLYGADNDEFAVNIAMLRLWLSLAIDYDGDQPEPLPNLDFKIVCGDSLAAPNPQNAPNLFRHAVHQAADLLASLKSEYLRETGSAKVRVADEIATAESLLRETLGNAPAPPGSVDWRVDFAEVFDNYGGFDVVLANPPYGIPTVGRFSTGTGRVNSYAAFMLLALDLGPSALVSYIIPTSWETGDKFQPFRKELFAHATICKLVNLPYDVFAAAYVDTCVVVLRGDSAGLSDFNLIRLPKVGGTIDHTHNYGGEVTRGEVLSDERQRIPLCPALTPVRRSVAEMSWLRLDQFLRINRGLATYRYKIEDHPFPGGGPLYDGNVYRYRYTPSSGSKWIDVPSGDLRFFQGRWIAIRRLVGRANRLMAAVMTDQVVVKEAILVGIPSGETNLDFLAAMLNSSLHSFIHLSLSSVATKDDFRQVTIFGLNELPVPANSSIQGNIASAGRRLRTFYEENPLGDGRDLENELDGIIFDALNLGRPIRDDIAEFLAASG